MAFKMKNPSVMKLAKMAGSNRTAMKMKMESAAKMKKEAAMKLKKDEAMKMKSTMKMKTPMKEDDVEAEVAAIENKRNKLKKAAGFTGSNEEFADLSIDQQVAIQKLGRRAMSEGLNSTYVNKKRNEILNPVTERTAGDSPKMMKKSAMKMKKGEPMKMKKDSAMKLDKKEIDKKNPKPGQGKGLNKPLDPKMGKKKPATKFNAKLKAASKAGKLSGKFKEAVDASPMSMKKPMKMKKAAMKMGHKKK